MQAAAKLGILVSVNQVGSDSPSTGAPTVSSGDGTKEWQPAYSQEEKEQLHNLRATLVQSLEGYGCRSPMHYFYIYVSVARLCYILMVHTNLNVFLFFVHSQISFKYYATITAANLFDTGVCRCYH